MQGTSGTSEISELWGCSCRSLGRAAFRLAFEIERSSESSFVSYCEEESSIKPIPVLNAFPVTGKTELEPTECNYSRCGNTGEGANLFVRK